MLVECVGANEKVDFFVTLVVAGIAAGKSIGWASLVSLDPCMTASVPVKVFFCVLRQGSAFVVGAGSRAPFSAFISTLDPVPATATMVPGTKLRIVFSELCSMAGTALRCEIS